jgi:ribosomal protein S18 acetylase RimI-like enzyme
MNKSKISQILDHLEICKDSFVPSLDTYLNLSEYSQKIHTKALLFERFEDNKLVGLIAAYVNDGKLGYITNVSIIPEYQGKGLSLSLLKECINYFTREGYNSINLEVFTENKRAIDFYQKNKFKIIERSKKTIMMKIELERDYNSELKDTNNHKYAYNFDFDVIHPYMIKSFQPHFVEGNCLELGSFKGDFTKRLLPHFSSITCVEASSVALSESKKKLDKCGAGSQIEWVEGLFNDVKLPQKYDNIILTHVLEHIDNPIELLNKINNEWLSNKGKLFIVVPNANAPSRQIAVKMGLIEQNTSITPSEKEHGHKITYTLDVLESHAVKSRLNVTNRSGIFFKALANFQWDQLLQTDIISKEYLDGCFALGQQYPDLCSSIMLVCKKG